MNKTLIALGATIVTLLLVLIVLLSYVASSVYTLQTTVVTTQEATEYFVYDNGTIQLVRDNGSIVTFCLTNADCDNGEK